VKAIRLNRLVTGIILLVGAVSGFFIYLGIQALGANDFLNALMYLGAGIGGFTVNGYRIYKIMKMSKTKSNHEKEVVTTLECNKCFEKIERTFTRGDYIYKAKGPCVDCSGQLVITKIFTSEEPH
jgi:hypothetical protein